MSSFDSKTIATETKQVGAMLTKNHLLQLDGLRGVAILLVVIFHFALRHENMHGGNAGLLLQLSQLGWAGVDLFFVLSGFLITSILLETKTQDNYFKNFLMRRFLRIWPIYYAVLLGLFVILPLVIPEGFEMPPELVSMQEHSVWFWFYAANWLFTIQGGFNDIGGGYFWSLAVEEQFYLFWPFAVYFLRSKPLATLALVLLAISIVARPVMLFLGLSPDSTYTATFSHLDGLAFGVLIAVAYRNGWLQKVSTKYQAAAIVMSLVGLGYVWGAQGNLFFWEAQMSMIGYFCVALLSAAVLVRALNQNDSRHLLYRSLTIKPLLSTGKYSYALYLFHVPVGMVMHKVIFDIGASWFDGIGYIVVFSLYFVTSLLLSWLAAYISWHVFEKHVLKLKVLFAYKS